MFQNTRVPLKKSPIPGGASPLGGLGGGKLRRGSILGMAAALAASFIGQPVSGEQAAVTSATAGSLRTQSPLITKIKSAISSGPSDQSSLLPGILTEVQKMPPSGDKAEAALLLARHYGKFTRYGLDKAAVQSIATVLAETIVSTPGYSSSEIEVPLVSVLAELVRYGGATTTLKSSELQAAIDTLAALEGKVETLTTAFPDSSGKLWSLKDLRGKVVLLDFWATFCAPCKKEMPDLQQLSQQFGDRLVVLGISSFDSVPALRKFAEQHHISYPLLSDLPDGGQTLYKLLDLPGIPDKFLLNPSGKVVARAFASQTRSQLLTMLTRAGLTPEAAITGSSASLESVEQGLREALALSDEARHNVIRRVLPLVRSLPASSRKVEVAHEAFRLTRDGDPGPELLTSAAGTLKAALVETPNFTLPGLDISPYELLARSRVFDGVDCTMDVPAFWSALEEIKTANLKAETLDFSLNDAQGKPWRLDTLRKSNNALVIRFFFGGTSDAREELMTLASLSQRLTNNVTVVGVTFGQPSGLKEFVELDKLSFPLLLDPFADVFVLAGISVPPHTIVYGHNGELLMQCDRRMTHSQLEQVISKTAAGSPGYR